MSNSAPVNVKLDVPTIALAGWNGEAKKWISLNMGIGGNPDFYPLTIKAAYVIGIIHSLCECVSILLRAQNAKGVTYIPAYGVFASGIELLGRCLRGNSKTSGNVDDLKAGYKWLASCYFNSYKGNYSSVPTNIVLVQTSKYMYSIDNLAALRHFAAHGQATSREIAPGSYEFGYIDFEILEHMPPLIANGLETYWNDLQQSEDLCNNLAAAKVIALRGWPVLLSWQLLEADQTGKHHTITELFGKFDWKVS